MTGEESAVVHYLNGGAPVPTFVPPRPYERGYRGRPTLIQNPETLAQLALVARFGSRWYRELGTVADPGSALVTITGAVRAPGVYELAFGTPMSDLLDAAGRSGRAAPGAARRRLLRHLGRGLRGGVAAARARGSALGRVLARLRRADRARRERVRPARERARDRLPGGTVRRPVRSVRVRAARDRRLGGRARRRRRPPARARARAPLGDGDPRARRLPSPRRRGAVRRERAPGVRRGDRLARRWRCDARPAGLPLGGPAVAGGRLR